MPNLGTERAIAFLDEAEIEDLPSCLKGLGCTQVIVRSHTIGKEFDFHCSYPLYIKNELSKKFALKYFIILPARFDITENHQKKTGNMLIIEANSLIENERFWEAHNVLEVIWRKENGKLKDYIRGIILIVSSMAKYQMGSSSVARVMYNRARLLLADLTMAKPILDQIPINFNYPVKFKIPLLSV
ncbi:MAG: DUF309 domain-containing protein [Ferroplasma sp.]